MVCPPHRALVDAALHPTLNDPTCQMNFMMRRPFILWTNHSPLLLLITSHEVFFWQETSTEVRKYRRSTGTESSRRLTATFSSYRPTASPTFTRFTSVLELVSSEFISEWSSEELLRFTNFNTTNELFSELKRGQSWKKKQPLTSVKKLSIFILIPEDGPCGELACGQSAACVVGGGPQRQIRHFQSIIILQPALQDGWAPGSVRTYTSVCFMDFDPPLPPGDKLSVGSPLVHLRCASKGSV